MLEFLKSLSDLATLERMPWRWWVGILVGVGGMYAIVANVEGEIAVVYVFVEMVAVVALTAWWQFRAEDRQRVRKERRNRPRR